MPPEAQKRQKRQKTLARAGPFTAEPSRPPSGPAPPAQRRPHLPAPPGQRPRSACPAAPLRPPQPPGLVKVFSVVRLPPPPPSARPRPPSSGWPASASAYGGKGERRQAETEGSDISCVWWHCHEESPCHVRGKTRQTFIDNEVDKRFCGSPPRTNRGGAAQTVDRARGPPLRSGAGLGRFWGLRGETGRAQSIKARQTSPTDSDKRRQTPSTSASVCARLHSCLFVCVVACLRPSQSASVRLHQSLTVSVSPWLLPSVRVGRCQPGSACVCLCPPVCASAPTCLGPPTPVWVCICLPMYVSQGTWACLPVFVWAGLEEPAESPEQTETNRGSPGKHRDIPVVTSTDGVRQRHTETIGDCLQMHRRVRRHVLIRVHGVNERVGQCLGAQVHVYTHAWASARADRSVCGMFALVRVCLFVSTRAQCVLPRACDVVCRLFGRPRVSGHARVAVDLCLF